MDFFNVFFFFSFSFSKDLKKKKKTRIKQVTFYNDKRKRCRVFFNISEIKLIIYCHLCRKESI